ncbi:MAG TPA: GSCFA domain-containing protein [Bacteroidia bacterium]|nr:GSCFA domain-containing protein [Bacteroidia bacterium]
MENKFKWQLEMKLPPYANAFAHKNALLLLGSCFSEEIGQRLHAFKFNALYNPCGIVYDALSINHHLQKWLQPNSENDQLCFEHNGIFHHPHYHSSLSSGGKEQLLLSLRDALQKAHQQLKQASHLIITLGTSYYYVRQSDGLAVANCHKLPAAQFEKKFFKASDSIALFQNTFKELKKVNPKLNIIITVSPVRHIKDGVVENNRSKAHLLETAHTLQDALSYVHYFPAYELVMDVLRDYRFYKEDLVHPNHMAADFVFQQFLNQCLLKEDWDLINEIEKINQALQHKAFFPESEAHKIFKHELMLKITELQQKYPHLKF